MEVNNENNRGQFKSNISCKKVETIQIIKLFTQCFFKCLYTRKLSDITAQTENNAHFE